MSITVMCGYSGAAVASCDGLLHPRSLVVVEHPDIVKERGLVEAVSQSPSVAKLVPVDHTVEIAADIFAADLKATPVVSVVPISDYATVFAARLAERTGVPGAGFAAARIMRNKDLLRRVTRAHQIPNPKSLVVESFETLGKRAAHLGYPVVVKPSNRQASAGTSIVTCAEELAAAYAAASAPDEGVYAPAEVAGSQVLIEEYLDGPEYSVEALVRNGKLVFANATEKLLAAGPSPVEAGHVVPARVGEAIHQELRQLTQGVITATGFCTGIVHCEWKVGGANRQLHLIECAGRFAGDGIIELVELSYGFDIVGTYHTMMRGEPLPPLPQRASRGSAVRFITPVQDHGRTTSITVDERRLEADPQVLHWAVTTEIGQLVPAAASSWQRRGSVTVLGHDGADAAQRAEASIAGIEIRTDQGLVPCL